MTEPELQKTPQKLMKTFRQWLGLGIVLAGSLIVLFESIALIPG